MCHPSCLQFGERVLHRPEVAGRQVLEVGSYDVNGSLRPLLSGWGPDRYVGVDIVPGPGVDCLCAAEQLVTTFGPDSFDLVICTEVLEHVLPWQEAIANIKAVCRPGGVILITTRSRGFMIHEFPHDCWRYELEDMQVIFGDCELLALERDPEAAGVFVKARKPWNFTPCDLTDYTLFNVR
jgi:SAM-dependent methyltransferase